jgi:hypothetical protein
MEASHATCVADIRQLCVEFQQAIAALASDDISALEAGIENQENLANKLQDWFRAQPVEKSEVKINPADLKELINLTRVYSSLLTRSIRTTRLRMALCQTYQQQQFSNTTLPQPETTPSLSCEV